MLKLIPNVYLFIAGRNIEVVRNGAAEEEKEDKIKNKEINFEKKSKRRKE